MWGYFFIFVFAQLSQELPTAMEMVNETETVSDYGHIEKHGKTLRAAGRLATWMPHAIVAWLFWCFLSKMVFNAFLSQISDFISWACLSSTQLNAQSEQLPGIT